MSFGIDDIEIGKPDGTGQIVDEIYIKIPPRYAIYRAANRVCVQFDDDEVKAEDQRKSMVNITVIRGTVDSLIEEVADSDDRFRLRRVQRYRRRLADTLQLALTGQSNFARSELELLRERLLGELRSQSSQVYLATAFATALALLILISVLSKLLGNPIPGQSAQLASLWFAAGVGAVGAVFSTVFSFQNRAILPSVSLRDTFVDSGIRILVGSLAGALTYAIVQTEIIGLKIGDVTIKPGELGFSSADEDWLRLLLLAFVAGISERRVPDLLNRVNGEKAAPAPSRLTSRDVLEDLKSSERNPTGLHSHGCCKTAANDSKDEPQQSN